MGDQLVGRDDDLARLHRLLDEHHLVTITGPGGVGKTTLALIATGSGNESTQQRVVVCELADVGTPEAVRLAVASQLHVAASPGKSLGGSLPPPADDARLDVVLDNCEHVLDAAADVAAELAEAGPHVRVLATSREPLRLPDERVLELYPLRVPRSAEDPSAATSPAVVLFDQRARSARPDFALDEQTLPDVVRICRALDGMPLALELAAARAQSLAVRDIADRLTQRFHLLRAGTRRTADRHRSVRAVVDWSYQLLDVPQRSLFAAMAVYAGGFDLEASTAAGADLGIDADTVIDILDDLVGKSMIVVSPVRARTRYGMLETLRSFGVDQLQESGDLDDARDRHATYFAALARQLRADGLRAWTPELEPLFTEFDNTRAALSWTLAMDNSADRTFELVAPLWYIGMQHRPDEVAALAGRALARWPQPDHPLWSEVAGTAAEALVTLHDFDGARERADAAVAADSSPVGSAIAWCAKVGVSELADDDPETALVYLDHADAAAAAAGFEPLRCDLMGRRAQVLTQARRYAEALEAAEQALAMARAQGNVYETAWSQHLVGLLLVATDPAAAEVWLATALRESRDSGYVFGTNSSLRGLGVVAAAQGDLPASAAWFTDALDRFTDEGAVTDRTTTVAAMLPMLVAAGRRESAAALLVGLVDAGTAVAPRIHTSGLDEVRTELVDELGSARISARGRALSVDQLFALARRELRAVREGDAGPGDQSTERRVPAAAGQQPPEVAAAEGAELRRAGELWLVTFAGTSAHVPNSKGMADLAVLLAQPGREVAALDLATTSQPGRGQAATIAADGLGAPGDLGERIDAQARAAYTTRIRELQADLDDADASGDPDRSARLQQELDFLTAELSASYGLRGPRRAGDPAEKARSAVTARVRATIAKIREAHPALGNHLRHAVQTGRFCSYRPDEPVDWQVTG